MNSTISRHDYKIGEIVYIPFWVVLDSLDITPPDPFIKSTIKSIAETKATSPDGEVSYYACQLELGKPGLIAEGIPTTYLIKSDKLNEWCQKLANWFSSYPASQHDHI